MTNPKTPSHPGTKSRVPAARGRRAQPSSEQRVEAVSSSAVMQQPLARRIPAQAESLATGYAYVAVGEAEVVEADPMRTAFFDSINQVKVVVAEKKLTRPEKGRSIAQVRGHSRDDLFAIAEVAHHYLMNGATKVARTLFEGLCAVSPQESYFALGLGLSLDHLGDTQAAYAAYTRASELDPSDGRPDVNRAELLLESGKVARAVQLLERGLAKARNMGDEALERKAHAMLKHLSRAA